MWVHGVWWVQPFESLKKVKSNHIGGFSKKGMGIDSNMLWTTNQKNIVIREKIEIPLFLYKPKLFYQPILTLI